MSYSSSSFTKMSARVAHESPREAGLVGESGVAASSFGVGANEATMPTGLPEISMVGKFSRMLGLPSFLLMPFKIRGIVGYSVGEVGISLSVRDSQL